MVQNGFSFTIDSKDQAHMQRVMSQLGTLSDNPKLKSAFNRSGNMLAEGGKQYWTHTLQGLSKPWYKKRTASAFKHRDAKIVARTMGHRQKNKNENIGVHIGHNRQSYKGVGKLAHIFDRGTKERYTKKGYYRGHIFKVNAPGNGPEPWTTFVKQAAPKEMRNIIEEINNTLTTIIVK